MGETVKRWQVDQAVSPLAGFRQLPYKFEVLDCQRDRLALGVE